MKTKYGISYFYNALLEYYQLHQAWCETWSPSSTEKTNHASVLAIGQLRHQPTTASSLVTQAADTVSAHQCHESDSDVRPTEYRWRSLFNAAVWLTPTSRVLCSNAAKTRNPLKLAGVPQTNETISAASGPKFTIL